MRFEFPVGLCKLSLHSVHVTYARHYVLVINHPVATSLGTRHTYLITITLGRGRQGEGPGDRKGEVERETGPLFTHTWWSHPRGRDRHEPKPVNTRVRPLVFFPSLTLGRSTEGGTS